MGPDAAELKEQMEALGGIAFAVEAFARATEEQRKNETLEAMRSASARTERSRSIDRRRSSLRDIFEMVATVKAVKKAGASRPKRGSLEVNTSIEDGEPPERARSNSLSPSDPGSPRRADPPTPLSDEDVCRLPSADSEGGEPGNGGCNGHLGNGGGGAALGGGTGGPATPNGVRVPEGRTALGGSVSQRQSWVPQSRLSVGEAGWFDKRVTSSAAEQQDPAAIRRGWRQRGLLMLARGEIAALVLAGGQGTRLGSSDPKGMYDIGLPSGRSLFQLQAERILRLQELCREQTLGKSNKWTRPIPWYVMTGPSTDLPTREYFRRMDFFGLRRDQVFFFCQGCLPAFSPQGQVLMEGIGRVSVAPDGNGGLYRALKASGALEDLRRRGVRGVDCYCVDNALAQFLDPEFLGYCDVNKAEVAARAVPKRGAEERVGVFAKCGGRLRVMEYTELDPALAVLRDPVSHQLVFNWSNICMQYFSTEFLAANHDFFENQGRYHIAQKRIQTIDGEVDGIKLEAFIFDTFVTADSYAVHRMLIVACRDAGNASAAARAQALIDNNGLVGTALAPVATATFGGAPRRFGNGVESPAQRAALGAFARELRTRAGYAPMLRALPFGFSRSATKRQQVESLRGHAEKKALLALLADEKAAGDLSAREKEIELKINFKACVDCHEWLKASSAVHGRRIVLREPKMAHVFEGGACSCGDRWRWEERG